MKKILLLLSVFIFSNSSFAANWGLIDNSKSFNELKKELGERVNSSIYVMNSVKEGEPLINSLKQLVYIVDGERIDMFNLKAGDKYFDVFSKEKNSLLRILEKHVENHPSLNVFEGNKIKNDLFHDEFEKDFPPYYLSCPVAVIYDYKTKEALHLSATCEEVAIDYSNYD